MENNSFVVMSPDTNHTSKIVFGGHVLAEMDKLAFCETLKFLESKNSVCDEAVTFKVEDVVFHCPAYLGDIVYLDSFVISSKEKSVVIGVRCKVWRKEQRKIFQFCQARFVFVTTKEGKPHPF